MANALGMLRHLYAQMVGEHVKDVKRAAEGLLGPANKEIERVESERAAAARTTPDALRAAVREILSLAGRSSPTHWTVSIPTATWDLLVLAQRAAPGSPEAALTAVRALLHTWESNRAAPGYGTGAPGPLYVAGMATESASMIAQLRAVLEGEPAP
jgi:hypothetical protein